MKKREVNQLRDKTVKELIELIGKKEQELRQTRLDVELQKVKNVHLVRYIRRDLAQVRTIMREDLGTTK